MLLQLLSRNQLHQLLLPLNPPLPPLPTHPPQRLILRCHKMDFKPPLQSHQLPQLLLMTLSKQIKQPITRTRNIEDMIQLAMTRNIFRKSPTICVKIKSFNLNIGDQHFATKQWFHNKCFILNIRHLSPSQKSLKIRVMICTFWCHN